MEFIHEAFRSRGLTRPKEGRVLGGVCAGLGRKLGLQPWPARIAFLLALLLIPGSQLVIYPLLWVAMPPTEQARSNPSSAQWPAVD